MKQIRNSSAGILALAGFALVLTGMLTGMLTGAAAPAVAEGGEHRAKIMERLDTNKDGAIDRAEFMAGRDAGFAMLDGPGVRAARGDRCSRLGGNGDGTGIEAEFDAAAARFREEHGMGEGGHDAGHQGRHGEWFARIDADGDGSVTRDEFDDAAERMFARFDRNGDGVLSPEDREHDSQG